MRRLQRRLGGALVILRGDEIVLRVLPVLQRHRLAGIEIVLTLLVDLRQVELRARAVQRAQRRDGVVQRLHGVGRLDDEQLLPALDDVARLDQELHDAARIGREDRRRTILVDGDLAFGDVLGTKYLLVRGLESEARPFRIGRHEARGIALDDARGFRLGALNEHAARAHDGADDKRDRHQHKRQPSWAPVSAQCHGTTLCIALGTCRCADTSVMLAVVGFGPSSYWSFRTAAIAHCDTRQSPCQRHFQLIRDTVLRLH